MNREILFRGRKTNNGKWVEGDLIHLPSGIAILANGYAYIDPETVGQYTGLKDKNEKKIFEGDIFKHRQFDYPDTFGAVKYRNNYDQYRAHNCCGFAIEWQNTSIDRNLREDLPFWCDEISNAEIVGNIYDNPELLEVK